jgi:hypothetical protein
MSEVAYFRFKSNNMLTKDEKEREDKIIQLTEEVLPAKGIECYSRISRRSQEQLKEILEEDNFSEIRRKIEILKLLYNNRRSEY